MEMLYEKLILNLKPATPLDLFLDQCLPTVAQKAKPARVLLIICTYMYVHTYTIQHNPQYNKTLNCLINIYKIKQVSYISSA